MSDGCDCEVARRVYKVLAMLMYQDEVMQIGVTCRLCWHTWYGEPVEEFEDE